MTFSRSSTFVLFKTVPKELLDCCCFYCCHHSHFSSKAECAAHCLSTDCPAFAFKDQRCEIQGNGACSGLTGEGPTEMYLAKNVTTKTSELKLSIQWTCLHIKCYPWEWVSKIGSSGGRNIGVTSDGGERTICNGWVSCNVQGKKKYI